MSYVLQILAGEWADEYVVDYDPEVDGVSPSGEPMMCRLVTTPDIAEAHRFTSFLEATECWRRIPERTPVRPDGRPNRPLTALAVTVLPV